MNSVPRKQAEGPFPAAPGNTCLSGLAKRQSAEPVDDFIKAPINQSKGCGGIMRVAPLALRYRPGETYFSELDSLDMEAAQAAAITHSHSLGYMHAAAAVHIISRCITASDTMTLKEIVLEARDTAATLLAGDEYIYDLIHIMNKAVELSENGAPDLENIHELGEGWVAEETLGIAIYCALKYQNDFSKAVTVAVNHNGDSDSTGVVTGNILGALLGYSAIEDKWKKDLELADVILELTDDLCHGCLMNEFSSYEDPAWAKVRYEVVKTGNRAKYGQNPDLLGKLLATGDSILAEASGSDDIWGIAMKAEAAAKTDPKQWPGKNLLGRILMELREELGSKK